MSLLLDSICPDRSRYAKDSLKAFKYDFSRDADISLGPILSGKHAEYQQGVCDLVDEAIALDKEISRQVSCVVWTFEKTAGSRAFDTACMELEGGKRPTKNDLGVAFVNSPGVLKQGKPTGKSLTRSYGC